MLTASQVDRMASYVYGDVRSPTSMHAARMMLARHGVVMLPGAVDRASCDAWRAVALSACKGVRLDVAGHPIDAALAVSDGGGAYRHVQIDGLEVASWLPELMTWYRTFRHALTLLCGREVIASPYPRSAVNVKVCERTGDEQGWHYDTNPLSVVLYLTPTTPRTGTEIEVDGAYWNVLAEPGDVLVFYGRNLWHRVPPMPAGPARATVIANYYHPDDVWRPPGIDELVYGDG